jgi:ketol-acid reductoisomerase
MKQTVKIYTDSDADIAVVKRKSVTVIGYGNQGRAFALNMRDSGVGVSVCLQERSKSASIAIEDDFPVVRPEDARHADVIMMMLPDHLHGRFFSRYLGGKLRAGQALIFAHGYSVHFAQVSPPANVLCALVAPHGPGTDLRSEFLRGSGISCFVGSAPAGDADTIELALSIAKAIGCTRIGAFESTFEHETLGDLFGEQALLCGGLAALTRAVFDILVGNGIPPENAYLETAHQLRLLAKLVSEDGISGMMQRISKTAQFGSASASDKILNKKLLWDLQRIFLNISSGEFAEQWQKEHDLKSPVTHAFLEQLENSEIERIGQRIRAVIQRK